MTFHVNDVVEALEDLKTDDGMIPKGMQLRIQQMSISGFFLRGYGMNGFVRAAAFRRVGRAVEAGGCAPPVIQAAR